MGEIWTVVAVHPTADYKGRPAWQVDLQTPGDVLPHLHVFPASLIEQRMAEYDLDPLDPASVDTALDMILHEQREPGIGPVRRGQRPGLFDHPDGATARRAHLDYIATVKRDHVHVRPPVGNRDPLDVIRRAPVDPERVERARRIVASIRARQSGIGALAPDRTDMHGRRASVPGTPGIRGSAGL